LQQRKFRGRNKDTCGPRDTRSSLKMPSGFERDDHLMHRWCRYREVPLDVGFGRRTTIDLRVVVDEREVLALASRERGLDFLLRSCGV